ncbi:AAA family ATPase [Colwellia sp. E2M01]|nr:AAA family ATPase [Colwellia sp. E2M01]
MGVSGTGKSVIAKKLADDISLVFIDADDFHSEQAKRHMAENKPLTDEMRIPWLHKIIDHLNTLYAEGKSVALAYSGLKSAHRALFKTLAFSCHFFYLNGDKSIIAKRISQRKNHFFSSNLLESQFLAMEPPECNDDVVIIDINQPLLSVSAEVIKHAHIMINQKLGEKE